MLLRGSKSRGARGQSSNRSRGRDQTSRGASNSSGTSPNENSTDSFEAERLENAAKREQQKSNGAVTSRGGRGNSQVHRNKSVRFTNPIAAATKDEKQTKTKPTATSNPFASKIASGVPATMSSNPFAPGAKNSPASSAPNPFAPTSQLAQSAPLADFGRPSGQPAGTETEAVQSPSLFGAPSIPFGTTTQANGIFKSATPESSSTSSTNPFGATAGMQPSIFSTTPSGSPASSFQSPGQSSTVENSPFPKSIFGAPSGPKASISTASPLNAGLSAFGTTTSKPPSLVKANSFRAPTAIGTPASGVPNSSGNPTNSQSSGAKTTNNGFGLSTKGAPQKGSFSTTGSAIVNSMDQLLRKQGINPPPWPTSTPGNPNQKDAIHAFWQTFKGYRTKVRASLIRAGLLDDPDKPKKLSEAIDFKGTCEDMCPEFERITRIVERDVLGPEKELGSDGTMWPAPQKMVKALARSAAGQDAPLPMDVRSPAALRRTFDYLLHTVLGEDGDLAAVHGFLWDRTRAIRRDFVFQSSMNQAELADQIYCLERITRFHVIALHQMSRAEVVAEDFSEQQEIEQLGKALLSLIHAYEDCQAQGIDCENEAEFRAYYVLFNCRNPGILETVQDWGWKFWGESEQIKIAVSLVEALQNVWDAQGPLKPHSATDIAQNGFSRFFSIVTDKKVSYTMACFAEIYFTGVRKAVFKTILTSHRKQRDQTKDWTLKKLNDYLRFDDEGDILEFGEAYGLRFQEGDEETYLSIESEEPSDPFPALKQRSSYALVERKRGDRSLPAVIDVTVFDEDENVSEEPSDEETLFVRDDGPKSEAVKQSLPPLPAIAMQEEREESAPADVPPLKFQAPPTPTAPAPTSIFGPNFFAPKPAEPSVPLPSEMLPAFSTSSSKPATTEANSPFSLTTQAQTKATPPFSFLNQPTIQPAVGSPQPLLSLEQPILGGQSQSPKSFFPSVDVSAPLETTNSAFSWGQQSVKTTPTSTPQFSLGGAPRGSMQPTAEDEPKVLPSKLAQQLSLPSPSPETSSILNPVPNFTSSGTPQAAPPLSQALPGSLSPRMNAPGMGGSFAPANSNAAKRKAHYDNLAEWVFTGNGGILDQWTEHHVKIFLGNAFSAYMREENEKRVKEEERQAQEKADQFRIRTLASRYGHRWRETARRMWMRKRGREARRARQEMAEKSRASKALQYANVVEDFRASANSSRRGSLESLLNATGVLNGVHDSDDEIRAITRSEEPKASKQRKSARSTQSPASSSTNHRRSKSDHLNRRSLLSDPSFLNGGSRVHLMSNYDARDETRRQVSGVQTDYFRLKARGISTLPNGMPLANSAAKDTLQSQRAFDGIQKPETPTRSLMPPPTARSVPSKSARQSARQSESPFRGANSSEVIEAMKAKARALTAEEPHPRKRSFDADTDEELFARAKRVREQMDEGQTWYQKQIERDTASRSVS